MQPRSNRGRRRPGIASLVATLTLLSACGGESAADDRAQDAPATTAAVDLYDGPDASEHVLVDADLPDGFKAYPFERAPRRADEPPPTVDDGSGICGLRNPADTSDPLDRVQVGYSRRTGGPFVYETVAIYKDEAAAAAVLEQADDAFAACVAGGAQEVPPVSGGPLDVGPFGDGSVAWQVRVQSSDTPTTSVPGMGSSASDMGTGSGEMGMGEGRSGSDMGAGRIGRLYVECGFSHRQVADPIVFPTAAGTPAVTMPMDHAGHGGGGPGTVEGVPGHLHDFFGATTTDGSSTATTLAAGGTTCADPADHSAYWVPTLFDHGTPVEPVRLRAWYGVAPGVDASQVQALPNGLQLIAGDIAATSPQSTSVVGWSCGEEPGGRSAEPPTGCTDDDPLTLQLTFPSCWDGEHLSSSDHRSHVAYPGADGCPARRTRWRCPRCRRSTTTGWSAATTTSSSPWEGSRGLTATWSCPGRGTARSSCSTAASVR